MCICVNIRFGQDATKHQHCRAAESSVTEAMHACRAKESTTFMRSMVQNGSATKAQAQPRRTSLLKIGLVAFMMAADWMNGWICGGWDGQIANQKWKKKRDKHEIWLDSRIWEAHEHELEHFANHQDHSLVKEKQNYARSEMHVGTWNQVMRAKDQTGCQDPVKPSAAITTEATNAGWPIELNAGGLIWERYQLIHGLFSREDNLIDENTRGRAVNRQKKWERHRK